MTACLTWWQLWALACDRACEHAPGSRQRMTHAGGGTSAVPQGTRMTLAPQRHATSRSLGQGTHGPAWHMASHLCTWQFSHRPHTWIKASAKQTVSYTTLHCSVTCDIPRATQPEHGEATWDNAVRQAVTACVHRGTLPPRGSHSPSLSSHAQCVSSRHGGHDPSGQHFRRHSCRPQSLMRRHLDEHTWQTHRRSRRSRTSSRCACEALDAHHWATRTHEHTSSSLQRCALDSLPQRQ